MKKAKILNIDNNNYVNCPALIKCNIETVNSVFQEFAKMTFTGGKEKTIPIGRPCTECKNLIMLDEKRKKLLCGY